MATVGCTAYPLTKGHTGYVPPGLTWYQQNQNFSAAVGRPCYNRKQYYGGTAGSPWATSVGDMQPFITNLWTSVICFKPAVDGSDWTHSDGSPGLKSSIQVYASAYQAVAGYPGSLQGLLKVVLYQEAQNVVSAADYITCMQNYYPLIKANWPHINVIVDLAGSQASKVNDYFPGASYCDELGLDLYCRSYINQGAYTDANPAQAIVTLANAHGKPFGFCELGNETNSSPKPWPTHADVKAFLGDYIIPVMLGTGAGATPGVDTPSDCMWYEQLDVTNDNPITDPSDYRAPYLRTLFDGLGGSSGIAQISGRVSLSAAGSSGAPTGAATVQATASLSAHGSASAAPAAQITTSAQLSTAGGATSLIVQQVSGASTYDYGLSTVEIETTQGSTLVVLAGWDLSTSPTSASMPAVWVSDSAANDWQHVSTTSPAVSGSRCSAWVCSNAQAIEWLSVSLTTFASSLAYTVLELDGNLMPQYFSLDVLDSAASASAPSLALAPGTTIGAGFGFAVMAVGGATLAPTVTGASWQALSSVISGATAPGSNIPASSSPNPVQIFPFITTPGYGENLGTTFTVSQSFPASAIVFAFPAATYPPYQENPNFPVLKVEMGFGAVPGDTSQAPPAWTDITNRVVDGADGTMVKVSSGRQYELATAEAGTIQISLNNVDGAFTPGAPGPFYPGIVLGTPVRVRAWWNGQWYPIAFGWTERLPQAWPDLPQWGIVRMTAHDAIAVAAAETMVSALNGDILVDAPYVLLPANEQYLSFSNGVSSTGSLGFYTSADAQGLLAQNYSRVNQRSGVYVDGNAAATSSGAAIAATGATTNLLGSADTGFGTDAISAIPTAPASGPGIIYTDPAMPDPVSGNGVTASFWVIAVTQSTSTDLQPVVFTAYGPPSSYRTGHASLSVQVNNYTGGNTLTVTLADGSTVSAPFNSSVSTSPTAQQITLTLTSSVLNVYVNGALGASASLTAAQTTEWNAVSLGCPNYAYQSGDLAVGSFTAFDLAIYAYILPLQRIVSQYATGIGGQQNVDATTRVAQILAWAGIGVPRSGQSTFNGIGDGVLQGPAYSLAGATATDAISQVAANHNAQVVASPAGALTYLHKWALFNQAPVAVFGDNPDPTQGQIPSLQATNWGYDDVYLYNIAQVTQQYGANNLFVFTAANFPSQFSYYPRTALAQTITTSSALDAADWANWAIALYSQPSLRVAGLSVDAASNPQAAFPVILGLQQGQVVTVTRSPVGGATISGNVLVQKVVHTIGATKWVAGLQLSPYTVQGEVLQLDTSGYDTVGSAVLA